MNRVQRWENGVGLGILYSVPRWGVEVKLGRGGLSGGERVAAAAEMAVMAGW